MFMEKSKVLADATLALNKPEQPWEATVEGDSIIARWKWMDATFFSLSEVSDEIRSFTFIVTLNDKGKWKELDKAVSKSASVSTSGIKLSASGFVGKKYQKSIEFGVGKNKQTGETGIIVSKFDTTAIKQPVRDYLTACGWKKAGLF